MKHAYNKYKTFLIIWNDSQKVTFHGLKLHLKLGYNWLHIWGVMIVMEHISFLVESNFANDISH